MAESPFGKVYLRGQLQKDFHSFFSRDQDHYREMTLRVAAAFFFFFVIYALAVLNQETYILTYAQNLKTDYAYIITNDFFYWISLVVALALGMLNVYICQSGYALRRDQFIVKRIRSEYNLLQNTFKGYGKQRKGIFYLPDLYAILILFITIIIMAIIIWTSFLLRLSLIPVVILALPHLMSVLAYCLYYIKYKINCRPDKITIESLLEPTTPTQ